MKYEFKVVQFLENNVTHHDVLCTMTGLDYDDVDPVVKSINRERWSVSLYIKALQQLGFNTNSRFIKFDPDTPYPVIARVPIGGNKGWYLFYYYDGILYAENNDQWNIYDDQSIKCIKGKWYIRFDKVYKITSMLQVWI